MATIGNLIVRLTLDASSFSTGMARVAAESRAAERSLRTSGRRLEQAGRSLATSFSLPIIAASVASGYFAVKFQSNMEMIRTQAGATQQEVARQSQAMLQLARQVPQSPLALSDALFFPESRGMRGAQAYNVMHVAAEGAAMGHANLAQTTNALGSAVVAHLRGTQNFSQAMGSLDAIVGQGAMHMQDLVSSFSTGILPAAQAVGLSVNELGAAMATMTDAGVPAQRAATYLRTDLIRLIDPTAAAGAALSSIGISQLQLAAMMQQPGGFIAALKLLKEHLAGLPQVVQNQKLAEMFGKSKGASTMILLLDNLSRVQMKYQQIGAQGADFQQRYAAYLKTAEPQLQQFTSALEADAIVIGNLLVPIGLVLLSDVIQPLIDSVMGLVSLFKSLPPWAQHVGEAFLVIAVAVGPALMLFGMMRQTMAALIGLRATFMAWGSTVSTAFEAAAAGATTYAEALATVFTWENAVLLGLPLLILGIGYLVDRAQQANSVVNQMSAFQAQLSASMNAVQKSVGGASQGIGNLGDSIAKAGSKAANNIQSFDQVHEITSAIAANLGAVTAPAMPVPTMPTMPGLPSFGAPSGGSGLLDMLKQHITDIRNAAMSAAAALGMLGRQPPGASPGLLSIQAAALALAATAVTVETSWSGLTGWLEGEWRGIEQGVAGIGPALAGTWQGIVTGAQSAWSGLVAWLAGAWRGIEQGAGQLGQSLAVAWQGIEAGATVAWQAVAGAISAAWATVEGYVASSLARIETGITTAWNAIRSQAASSWATVTAALAQTWATISGDATTTWATMTQTIGTGWQTIETGASTAWATISASLSKAWSGISGDATTTWGGIAQTIGAAWTSVETSAKATWGDLTSWLTGEWATITKGATSLGTSIHDGIVNATAALSTDLQTAWSNIAGALAGIWSGITSVASSAWVGIVNGITTAVNAFISPINDIIKEINSAFHANIPLIGLVSAAAVAGVVAAFGEGAGVVAAFASGGIVTGPTLGLVGEAGPEAVLPLSGGAAGGVLGDTIGRAVYQAVTDALGMSGAQGQGGQQDIVLTIDGKKFARALLPAILREGQRIGAPILRVQEGNV